MGLDFVATADEGDLLGNFVRKIEDVCQSTGRFFPTMKLPPATSAFNVSEIWWLIGLTSSLCRESWSRVLWIQCRQTSSSNFCLICFHLSLQCATNSFSRAILLKFWSNNLWNTVLLVLVLQLFLRTVLKSLALTAESFTMAMHASSYIFSRTSGILCHVSVTLTAKFVFTFTFIF